MNDTRFILIKIQLNLSNGTTPVITVATKDKERLPLLIERNKIWFEKPTVKLVSWKYISDLLPFNMPQEQYEEEVAYCDIVDEVI